jgi:predicted transcriptional regulator of viral defense system
MLSKYFSILEGFCMGSSREKRAVLMAVAAQQGGYFTARQAIAAGYAYPRQHYHVQIGDWERVERGVFRLYDYPQPERGDLITLSLLSHDRTGQPQAVVSHDTALVVHDIGDVNPARVHLTVPPGFRRQLSPHVALHRAVLSNADWEERDGFRVTTPLRTLLDIASSPASWPYLDSGVRDALRRGMVRSRQLLSAVAPDDARARLLAAVVAVGEKADTSR